MDLPAHQLTMTVLMTPDTANFAGNVHGGTILKLLDQVAYACASRYAARYVVTLSVDQVMFRQPVHVGELVSFLASVNHTGTSSMEVGIKVIAQDMRSQATRHVNSCFFTMVAVGDARKPVAVPPLRQERAQRMNELRAGAALVSCGQAAAPNAAPTAPPGWAALVRMIASAPPRTSAPSVAACVKDFAPSRHGRVPGPGSEAGAFMIRLKV